VSYKKEKLTFTPALRADEYAGVTTGTVALFVKGPGMKITLSAKPRLERVSDMQKLKLYQLSSAQSFRQIHDEISQKYPRCTEDDSSQKQASAVKIVYTTESKPPILVDNFNKIPPAVDEGDWVLVDHYWSCG